MRAVLFLTDGGSIASGADEIFIGEMNAGSVKTVDWTIVLPHVGTYSVLVEALGIDSDGNPCKVSESTSISVRSSSLPTDINKDGIVDIMDIAFVAGAFNTSLGDPKWNGIADLDNNGLVDILDISKVARDFNRS